MIPADHARRFYPGQTVLITHLTPPANRWGKPRPKYEVDRIMAVAAGRVITARHDLFDLATLKALHAPLRLVRPDHITDLPRPGWYAEQWRRLKAMPDTDPRLVYPWWNWAGETVTECKQKTRLALHQRINARGGQAHLAWRRFTDDNLWTAWRRDQRKIHDHLAWRLIIRQFETAECRQRFSHLVHRPEDD